MMSRILAPALALLLASCELPRTGLRREVSAGPAGAPQAETVLFIGNSYSFDVPERFRRIAKRHGRDLRVGRVAHSGWSLAKHLEDGGALREIRGGGWDVVVIQEYSRLPAIPSRRTREMLPNVRKLADEARAAGATPVIYQTWGRRDGDPRFSAGDDFISMNRRVREGCRAAARAAGGIPLVPVGDAWEREMLAGRGARLFMADGSHPSRHGVDLAARVFFDTLIRTRQAF
jgi:hypothetical protein